MISTELAIVKGIGPVPGDTASAEQPIQTLNLLSIRGFSVAEDGWIPKVAALKNNAVYAETPLADGRQLVASARGNVTEQMVLSATGSDWQARYWLESQLHKMADDARNFWQTDAQIEPVYLKWWAQGAPGPQYALIYNLEIAPERDVFDNYNVNQLAITIEREPYWRGIAPGANPKLWSTYFRGTSISTMADLLLEAEVGGNENSLFASNALNNHMDWNGSWNALDYSNRLTVPAADIPGDAPALLNLNLTSLPNTGVYIWKTTKPLTLRNRSGTTIYATELWNAIDGNYLSGADTSSGADTGAPTGFRVNCNFNTTPGMALRNVWPGAGLYLNSTLLRGRYVMLLRARLSGTPGAVNIRLDTYSSAAAKAGPVSLTARLTSAGAGGTGNTTEWIVLNMGTINFPFDNRVNASLDGRGVSVDQNEYQIQLWAERTAGTVSLYLSDLILMAIDEGCILINKAGSNTMYDNTGYATHGLIGDTAIAVETAAPYRPTNFCEIQGSPLMLTPGVDNVLHFLSVTPETPGSAAVDTFVLRGNIVPRWSGVRDR